MAVIAKGCIIMLVCGGAALQFSCSPAGPVSKSAALVHEVLADDTVAEASAFAGDGLAAKRALLPQLYPELADLIAAGSEATQAIVAEFSGTPSYLQDDQLFLLAYALEQINDPGGLDPLVRFVDANITGEVPTALAAATHAIRGLLGMASNDTASYLGSEIEETLTAAGFTEAARFIQERGPQFESCWREFVLTDGSGQPLTYPAGHPKAGQRVVVGGTIVSGDTRLPASQSAAESNRVEGGGGSYVTYTDPEHSDVTFEGQPTRRFNCAGFAFRQFNDGLQWNAEPGSWFAALTAVGAIEAVPADGEAAAGDFVFYFGEGSLPAHVAEVQRNDFVGGVTVINADRWSGLFTADIDAAYFFGANIISQELFGGLESRYRTRQIWRWTNGRPSFAVNTNRSADHSCHGEDDDGDGFPEMETCTIEQRCIDPELSAGAEGGNPAAPRYQIFLITNYGSMEGGYLTILLETAPADPPLLRSYPGGGINPEVTAELSPFTAGFFDTPQAAAESICGGFSGFWRPPLASFILAGVYNGVNYGVDGIFQSVCGG